MNNSGQRGFAQIFLLVILLIGVGLTVYLVQQQTHLFSKASGPLSDPISNPVSNVSCAFVEAGVRGGGNIVSGNITNVSKAQKLALVATIRNDDGKRDSIQWVASGGTITNSSWDLTEWLAPTSPGSYTVSLFIYGKPQATCTSTFVVSATQSAVSCSQIETGARGSGNVLSGKTTNVQAGQNLNLVASIQNDDGNHSSIAWTTTGGVVDNGHWDLSSWTAPSVPGLYTIDMTVYGVYQLACSSSFLVGSSAGATLSFNANQTSPTLKAGTSTVKSNGSKDVQLTWSAQKGNSVVYKMYGRKSSASIYQAKPLFTTSNTSAGVNIPRNQAYGLRLFSCPKENKGLQGCVISQEVVVR